MAEVPAPTPDHEQQPDAVALTTEDVAAEATNEPAAAAPEATVAEADVPEADVPEAGVPEADVAAVAQAIAPEPAAPEPVAAPVPAPEPAPAAGVPTVASTVEVPANPAAAAPSPDQEGGEWDLLVQKLRHWIASGQLQEQWQAARTPLSLLAGLIALLLVLRVYNAVLNVLESIPLLPGLLELAGLVAVVQFSITRLVRSDDRRQVIGGVKQRWQSFRGRS